MTCDWAILVLGGIIVALGFGIVIELAIIIMNHRDHNE